MKKVLVIDDCQDFREAAAMVLKNAGYDAWEAASPKDAYQILESQTFDLVLCDLHMPLTSDEEAKEYVYSFEVGVRTIQELSAVFPKLSLVALSTVPQADLSRIARYLDPVPAFSKPRHNSDFLSLVQAFTLSDAVAIVQ